MSTTFEQSLTDPEFANPTTDIYEWSVTDPEFGFLAVGSTGSAEEAEQEVRRWIKGVANHDDESYDRLVGKVERISRTVIHFATRDWWL
jgi:hypothetical protein